MRLWRATEVSSSGASKILTKFGSPVSIICLFCGARMRTTLKEEITGGGSLRMAVAVVIVSEDISERSELSREVEEE